MSSDEPRIIARVDGEQEATAPDCSKEGIEGENQGPVATTEEATPSEVLQVVEEEVPAEEPQVDDEAPSAEEPQVEEEAPAEETRADEEARSIEEPQVDEEAELGEHPLDTDIAEIERHGPELVGIDGELSQEVDEDDEVILSRLESLIFVSPEPITVRRLARILSVEGKRVRKLLDSLREHYENRGVILQEVSGGFQFRSHPKNAEVIRQVFKLKPLKISRAALETLAIVAYRQPLTRAEVEGIRGVDCGGTLKFLFEKGFVRVFGRKEEPGRPIIYGTSQQFLELFGLKSLHDLPALHEFSELWDEHQEIVETSGLKSSDETPESDSESSEVANIEQSQSDQGASQESESEQNSEQESGPKLISVLTDSDSSAEIEDLETDSESEAGEEEGDQR